MEFGFEVILTAALLVTLPLPNHSSWSRKGWREKDTNREPMRMRTEWEERQYTEFGFEEILISALSVIPPLPNHSLEVGKNREKGDGEGRRRAKPKCKRIAAESRTPLVVMAEMILSFLRALLSCVPSCPCSFFHTSKPMHLWVAHHQRSAPAAPRRQIPANFPTHRGTNLASWRYRIVVLMMIHPRLTISQAVPTRRCQGASRKPEKITFPFSVIVFVFVCFASRPSWLLSFLLLIELLWSIWPDRTTAFLQ